MSESALLTGALPVATFHFGAWEAVGLTGALLAAGITAWLCIQAFINMAVVTALVPVTGITLPFISAGGSSLVAATPSTLGGGGGAAGGGSRLKLRPGSS